MSAWRGKYVIGLTGNIATGKSVVRKMLEHLGAYGIDADALTHRAIAEGAPGYAQVVEMFGKWILDSDGQIERARLGKVVFSDPEALSRLEAIVHPLVGQAVDILIRRSRQRVIVVEAIKLIEAGLAKKCDSVWTTYAQPELQLARLMQKRGLSEAAARQRIAAQPPQEQKTAKAQVVVRNNSSFESTWREVQAAWKRTVPEEAAVPAAPKATGKTGELTVQRARPREADEIAAVIRRLSGGRQQLSHEEVMAAFGEKAFLLLKAGERAIGLAGWRVENLVARTDDIYLENGINFSQALKALMQEVERVSQELQCEISLLYLPSTFTDGVTLLRGLGYQPRTVNSLGVRAWQEAALEQTPADTVLLFKQLRQDRVMRPV